MSMSAEDLVQEGDLGAEHHALAGQGHRGLDQVGEGQPPEAPSRLAEARDHPGHGHRGRPDVEHLVGAAEGDGERAQLVRVERPAPRPEAGHGDEEVEQGGLAVGRALAQQEAAGARPGERALGDRAGERGGADGVDRAPAARERLRPRPRGQAVAGRDRPDGRVGPRRYAASSGSSSRAPGRRKTPVELGVQLGRGRHLDVEDPGRRAGAGAAATTTAAALARRRRVGQVEARDALGPAGERLSLGARRGRLAARRPRPAGPPGRR